MLGVMRGREEAQERAGGDVGVALCLVGSEVLVLSIELRGR